MDREPVIEISDLTVARDGRRLLSDVALAVRRGSVHLLVGPNGAGKSTLFRAVLGLLEFTGTIRFYWRAAGNIGYVPQSFTVDRTLPLTVGEFLALGRQRRPVCLGIGRAMRARIEEVLAQVGLAAFFSRSLGSLSGGEMQRVLLANAVTPAPELLLLDEPASGLDEMAVQQFEAVISALRESGQTTVLMVSHDLRQVKRLADRVTVLDLVVRRTGAPAQVLAGDLADSLGGNRGRAL